MWRYKDFVKEEDYTSNDIAFFYSKREENRKTITDYKFITDANLCVTAFGGDQSTLTGLLGEYKYDGTRTFSTEGVRKWTESLHFDRENDENSNVEMINMKVEPIWTFIKAIDEDVALVVKAHVIYDAKAMQALLGERNFFSTQFPNCRRPFIRLSDKKQTLQIDPRFSSYQFTPYALSKAKCLKRDNA